MNEQNIEVHLISESGDFALSSTIEKGAKSILFAISTGETPEFVRKLGMKPQLIFRDGFSKKSASIEIDSISTTDQGILIDAPTIMVDHPHRKGARVETENCSISFQGGCDGLLINMSETGFAASIHEQTAHKLDLGNECECRITLKDGIQHIVKAKLIRIDYTPETEPANHATVFGQFTTNQKNLLALSIEKA